MNIFLREADYDDSNMFFTWVNKKDSLDVKIQNKSKIDLKNHDTWFLERLSDSNTYIWVIENSNKVPLGQIRFQKKCLMYFEVDIYIISTMRLKGIAIKALNMAVKKTNNFALKAIVKKNNIGSYKLFIKCGFSLKFEDDFKWTLVKE
jgi:L-amino acid N-acyltransferase YncA